MPTIRTGYRHAIPTRITRACVLTLIALAILPLHANEPLDDKSAILSGPESQAIFDQGSRKGPVGVEGLWTPSPDQVAAVWQALPAFLNRPPSILQQPLDTYHRQYVGFLREGRRFIYLNAFRWSRPEDDRWRKKPVVVFDGGPLFFGVEYDVEAKKLLNFAYNDGIVGRYPSRKE